MTTVLSGLSAGDTLSFNGGRDMPIVGVRPDEEEIDVVHPNGDTLTLSEQHVENVLDAGGVIHDEQH